MPWARASQLDRHLICPAASQLPRYDRGKWEPGYLQDPKSFVTPLVEVEDRSTDAADWGTAMHAAKANEEGADPRLMALMDPHRERLWPSDLGDHEVAVSYNCATKDHEIFICHDIKERDKWKMERAPECVVGTCDWWGELPTGEPWVDDLKTGWSKPDPMAPQMLFYLMVRLKHAREWDVGRISMTHWPRRKPRRGQTWEECDFGSPTREKLWRKVPKIIVDEFEEQLYWAWRRATSENRNTPRPGGHCLYCPSMAVCEGATL